MFNVKNLFILNGKRKVELGGMPFEETGCAKFLETGNY